MDLLSSNYLPGDHRLIEQIMRELKSQGIFDQFRKECISDVDTKPAYQNLRQRVEGSVSGFLTSQTWNPEMNKNQVREMLRKNIYESGFLETGVERIVDQVVNPKITTVFLPQVEDVVYKFLGIEKPVKTERSISSPLKINTFHDLLPKDLEAISPELTEEKMIDVTGEIEDVKMEDEESQFEGFNEKNEKMLLEENSVDSQFSILSGAVSVDSNHSLKQDSLMSLNSSESRMSIVTSESTSKLESKDMFLSQKSSDSNSKTELLIDEEYLNPYEQDGKKESEVVVPVVEECVIPNEVKSEKNSEEAKSKDSSDKKRRSHHSSSDRSKSRSDKDRSRSDKHKKEEKEKETSKEQKVEKENYRIPKLSDKNKTEKDAKSKDDKSRGKYDKDIKTDKDRKSDKDRRSSKHSSERDRSKSDSKSRRDSKSDKKEKDKEDKREKKESLKSEKSKNNRKSSSSSSKKRESSSSKDRHKDKDRNSSGKRSNDETSEKYKNGQSSTTSSSTKKDGSKYKKDEDRSRSSYKKDDKTDKDDKKKKRSSKDDHYSSNNKNTTRRSSDRDSDGPSNSKRIPATPQELSEKTSTQKSNQESSCSNFESSTGDSGNSDNIEYKQEEESASLQAAMQKIKMPKFASNLQEAMKIMKIRKQLKKLETMHKSPVDNSEVKKLLKDIADLSKEGKREKQTETVENYEKICQNDIEENQEKESPETSPLDINDFISSSNISMAKWNALEAKFMEQVGSIDYDSYESPYIDDDSNSVELGDRYGKVDSKIGIQEHLKQEIIEENEQKIIDELNRQEMVNEENLQEMFNKNRQEKWDENNHDNSGTYDKKEDSNSLNEDENMFERSSLIDEEEIIVENPQEIIVNGEDLITEEIIEETIVEDIDDTSQLNEEQLIIEMTEQQVEIEDNIKDTQEFGLENPSEVNSTDSIHTELVLEPTELFEKEEIPVDSELNNVTMPSIHTSVDNFNKKALVLLEKHSLTEDIIKVKRNGDCSATHTDEKKEFMKDKSLKLLEVEKENIEINNMVIEETQIEDMHMKNIERNHVMQKDLEETSNLMENRVEHENSEILNLFSKLSERNLIENKDSINCTEQVTLSPNLNAEESLDDDEEICRGFSPSPSPRNLTTLSCLIKRMENHIHERKEALKKLTPEKEKVYQTRKRKQQEEKCNISNNNLDDSASKRLRASYSSVGMVGKVSVPIPKKNNTEENIDIPPENKFNLPLSPAESEPSVERQGDVQIIGTKNKRTRVCKKVVKTKKAKNISQVKECKLPTKSSNERKNATKQRYSGEDLYKPRIFLRRNGKRSNTS